MWVNVTVRWQLTSRSPSTAGHITQMSRGVICQLCLSHDAAFSLGDSIRHSAVNDANRTIEEDADSEPLPCRLALLTAEIARDTKGVVLGALGARKGHAMMVIWIGNCLLSWFSKPVGTVGMDRRWMPSMKDYVNMLHYIHVSHNITTQVIIWSLKWHLYSFILWAFF